MKTTRKKSHYKYINSVVYLPIKALYDFERFRQLLGQPSNTVL